MTSTIHPKKYLILDQVFATQDESILDELLAVLVNHHPELTALTKQQFERHFKPMSLDEYRAGVERAREDAANGRLYNEEEALRKILGS